MKYGRTSVLSFPGRPGEKANVVPKADADLSERLCSLSQNQCSSLAFTQASEMPAFRFTVLLETISGGPAPGICLGYKGGKSCVLCAPDGSAVGCEKGVGDKLCGLLMNECSEPIAFALKCCREFSRWWTGGS